MKGDSCCCCIRIRIAPPHAPAFPIRLPPPCVGIFGFAQVRLGQLTCRRGPGSSAPAMVCALRAPSSPRRPYRISSHGLAGVVAAAPKDDLFLWTILKDFFFVSRSLLPWLFFARPDQPMITQGMGISWFMRWSPLALLVHTVIHAQTGHERMVRYK